MTSEERREGRFQRRNAKRLKHRQERCEALGGVEDVFSGWNLYTKGKTCCNGVGWKQSTQNFNHHRISITATTHGKIIKKRWKPMKYNRFTLCERGKERVVDAPHIRDRQVHKVLSQDVLYPLYTPSMIYDNGASLPGKGLSFSYSRLKLQLHDYYRKHGNKGWIIKIDIKDFFPNAPHDKIYERHKKYILDDDLRRMADQIIDSFPGDRGMLLGVEPSQLEMVALPSEIDNYMKCQLSLKYASHYMDDYLIFVETKQEAQEVMKVVVNKFEDFGMKINMKKTRIQRLDRPFRFCKAKFQLLENGRILVHGDRKCMQRDRRKMKLFQQEFLEGKRNFKDIENWFKSIRSYYLKFNDHGRVLKLNRMFYAMFLEPQLQGGC